jgi:hypothetical protein
MDHSPWIKFYHRAKDKILYFHIFKKYASAPTPAVEIRHVQAAQAALGQIRPEAA